jgi:hypothetical protein
MVGVRPSGLTPNPNAGSGLKASPPSVRVASSYGRFIWHDVGVLAT